MPGFFCRQEDRKFEDHPRFAGVKIAVLIRGTDSEMISVSQLEIAPGVEVPIHTHDPHLDSIYVLSGLGEAYINGQWRPLGPGDYLLAPANAEHGVRNMGKEPLRLFIHHSPPML